jgi:flagellar assembly protein FliH
MADVFQVFSPRVVAADVEVSEPLAKSPTIDERGYQPWVLPKVSSTLANTAAAKKESSAHKDIPNDADLARDAAKKHGFEQGLAEGRAEAKRILAEQSQQLQLALAALREPQKWVDTELERELLAMTLTLSRQLLRHELSVRPELIENLVHQAIEALPLTSGDLNIYLNPADVEVLRELAMAGGEPIESSWILLEDPSVSRGGCRISNECSRIDEELETRLQRITAEMLGEQTELTPDHG